MAYVIERDSRRRFGQQMLSITRSTVYVIARYHPSGKAGWLTKPHPKNGDWRRFTISKQMCQAVQEHIEEYSLGPDERDTSRADALEETFDRSRSAAGYQDAQELDAARDPLTVCPE